MKILVVDDDKEIVELLSIYVKNEGYEVVKAYDGKQALEKISAHPDIDLMILDIMMPVLSRYDVIKKIKKDTILKDIPIIFLGLIKKNSG